MPIRVKCPVCGKGLKAGDEHAGTTHPCPQCGELLKIPIPQAPAPPPTDWTSQPIAASTPRPTSRTLRTCKDCDGQVSKSATKCPHCGARLQTTAGQMAAIGCLGIFCLFAGCIVLAGLTAKSVPWQEADNSTMAYIKMQHVVEKQLKSPGSAEWPGIMEQAGDVVKTGPQTYMIQSWVDSQNLFGAKVRTHFVGEIKQTGEHDWELISFRTL